MQRSDNKDYNGESDSQNKPDLWNPLFMGEEGVSLPRQDLQVQVEEQQRELAQRGQPVQQNERMQQSQQKQQQQQVQFQLQDQQYKPQVKFNFVNPWGGNGEHTDAAIPLDNVIEEGLPQPRDSVSSEAFRRRKSSLIIPPARAPGPNPFEYDDVNQHPNIYNAQQPQQQLKQRSVFVPNQHNQQSQQRLNSLRFVPSSLYTGQDPHRRQSVAVVNYPTTNNTTNTITNNAKTKPLVMSTGNPGAYPYRRLSAYPPSTSPTTSLQPPYKQLRRDGNVQVQSSSVATQIIIPQMRKCRSRSELSPNLNPIPQYRRASLNSKTISPLIALTKSLITTYSLCSPEFSYQTSKNPKRVLTKPNEAKYNNGYDNINSDYILYVNDILGTEQNRKYLVLDILGQGTFGQVVKCQNVISREMVAVKVVKSRAEYLNQSITEAKILELLNTKVDPLNEHHFLRLHDTFVHKNHLCLVFELLSKNLYELLKQNQFHGLTIHLIRSFTTQLLDSLSVLKDSKLVHCDLKPENILLCCPDKPDLKIVDFGSSCEERRTVYTYIQSRFYRAPEVILGIPYSTSIDMWSLGCIVAELFLGIPIFPGSSEFNQLTRIVKCLGYPPTWMMEMGKNTTKFLKKTDYGDGTATNDSKKYRIKTEDEFNEEYNTNEQPSKQYFKWTTLPEVIKHYRLSKKIKGNPILIEQEMRDRDCLTHFLAGILNINPLERWTPQQAAMHPFITQQPFTGEWYPPGSLHGLSSSAGESTSGIPKRPKNIRHPSLQEGTAREFNKLRIVED
ncbi:hypothetical protein HG535_0C00770 [Zygotorulaspora mrakii]|uniref:Protein kinase domain-containing protein n=1 Tax=Zygotorulaspora mrakii TaxID=42260 RepID=A0A7H9AZ86_ZYGMR|nr:uncharacterized protein HG535_0C00770 [Zygotorulaspora mrakii]QLG71728.1 hypothetical protein HG535_0C00770 [Zygotorulaspora mrakii]